MPCELPMTDALQRAKLWKGSRSVLSLDAKLQRQIAEAIAPGSSTESPEFGARLGFGTFPPEETELGLFRRWAPSSGTFQLQEVSLLTYLALRLLAWNRPRALSLSGWSHSVVACSERFHDSLEELLCEPTRTRHTTCKLNELCSPEWA